MILAMNMFEDMAANRKHLAKDIGFSEKKLELMYNDFRPLGACSAYIWNDIQNYTDGNID